MAGSSIYDGFFDCCKRQVETPFFDQLRREAQYALNSHSRDLVYQTYGSALAAYKLGAITKPQFDELNNMLVVHGLNDPAHCKLD